MRRLFLLVIPLFALALSAQAQPQPHDTPQAPSAVNAINELRRQAGMSALTNMPELARAALSHARYMAITGDPSHDESPGRYGFTGRRPGDRVVHAGANTRWALENLFQGQTATSAALDGLMAAIYHRFTFLNFEADALGTGFYGHERKASHAFELSNTEVNDLCSQRPSQPLRHFYTDVCKDGIKLDFDSFEAALGKVAAKQPDVVLWPPENGSDIPPAFFDETPDPLPDLAFSGYPISVSFNPRRFHQGKLLSLKLFDDDSGQAIRDVRLLTQENDPNKKLNAHEFALFPLQRLAWGKRYRAEASLMLDGRRVSHRWTFTTRQPQGPFYKVSGKGESIRTSRDGYLTVYIPPHYRAARLGRLEYRYPQNLKVRIDNIDPNTLRIHVRGRPGSTIKFTTSNGHRFSVVAG